MVRCCSAREYMKMIYKDLHALPYENILSILVALLLRYIIDLTPRPPSGIFGAVVPLEIPTLNVLTD